MSSERERDIAARLNSFFGKLRRKYRGGPSEDEINSTIEDAVAALAAREGGSDVLEPMEETLKRSTERMLEILVARGVIHFTRLERHHRVGVRSDGSWHMKHPLSCELELCPVDALMRGGVGPDQPGEYLFVNGRFVVSRTGTEKEGE